MKNDKKYISLKLYLYREICLSFLYYLNFLRLP